MHTTIPSKLRFHRNSQRNPEPHWPARVAMLALAGLYAALPSSLFVGAPRWFVAAVVVALLFPIEITNRRGKHSLNQLFGYILNGIVTAAMGMSLVLLISAVTKHTIQPQELLRSAAALWIANILVFASCFDTDLCGHHAHTRALGNIYLCSQGQRSYQGDCLRQHLCSIAHSAAARSCTI